MRRRLKRIFSAALAGIVFCTAITFYPVETKATGKTMDVWEGVSSADWMSNLEDDVKISQINLPGTHDSGTQNVSFSSSAQCQDTSIADQLNNGIRFLDIRLGKKKGGILNTTDEGTLKVVHGKLADCFEDSGNKTTLLLDKVLQDCYSFLEEHRTETIVMSMKLDDESFSSDKDFADRIYNKYITDDVKDKWFLQNGNPSLGDARGKIVLVRRYYNNPGGNDYGGNGIRIFWSDSVQNASSYADPPWAGSFSVTGGGTGFYVQDQYNYSVSDKWKAVQQGLNSPPNKNDARNQYFLNFMSTAGGSSPKSSAETINANFLSYNNGSLEYGKSYGWIIMDFATEELARHVYKSNKSVKLEVASTIKALESAIPAEVAADMTLPSDGGTVGGVAGTSITWSCNPTDVLKVNGTTATLVCPASGDVAATLKATVSLGSYSQQKEFTIQVKGLAAVFADLGTALRKAEAFYEDTANARYNLDSLKGAIETAQALVQAGADKVTNTQVRAATETLQTLMEKGFDLKDTAELRENLLGWYPLTASSHDVSGNHNNGTATGVTFSKENGAAFTGGNSRTSYISLPAAMFDRTEDNNNLTVSFWVKDSRGDKSNAFGFGASTACSSGKHFIVNSNDGGNIVVSACPNGWGADPAKIVKPAPNADTWFHLSIVMEGKTLTVYKNGEKLDSVTEDYSLAEMGNNVFAYIGNAVYAHNPYGGDKDFKGNIKDFRVYGCAVAPEQAAAIYNDNAAEDTSTSSEHLLAHYPLTADSKDVSGNQYDATATGVSFSAENGAAFTGGAARTSYLSLPTEIFDRILGNDRMTVSFWVKDDQGNNHNAFGFGNGTQCNPDNGGAKHFIVNTNDGGNLLVNACPKGWQGNTNKITTAAPAANTWCHLTIVMEGKTLSLYKDGAKVNTVTADYSPAEMGNVAFAYIGNAIYAHNGDKDFKGNIKDFRIYDYALSEEEATGFMEESIKDELMADLQTALNLDIAKGEDGSLSMSITDGSLTLPTTACGGAATISWVSSNPDVIDNSGKVTLPGAEEPVADVTLTATVTMQGKTSEIVFHCSVFTRLDVDTADLQAVVSSAETVIAGLKEEDYTATSWQNLQEALAAAKQQLTKPTSETEVSAAAADLQTKKNALARLGDKTALNSLINTVKSLKQADYTTASWAVLQTALTEAEDIAKSNDVSQADVDAAQGKLESKKNALVKLGDKTDLEAAIAAAEALNEDDYVSGSWTSFQEVLAGVRQTFADTEATEEEVREAEALLQEAVNRLEKITYIVTFEPDNGSDSTTVAIGKGEMAEAPQAPEKEGYAFEGWFAEGGEAAFDFENTPITADITLTARWTKGHTVSFHPDNMDDGWTVTVKDGEKVSQPQTPEKEGHTFEGWFAEGEETAFDFENTPVTADIVLTAKWKETQGGGDNPGGDNPGGENPGGDNPGGNNPGGENPGGNKPGGSNPGGDGPGQNDKQPVVSIGGAVIKLSKTTLTYNGKAQKPVVTVTYNGKALAAGKDYDVSYSNNKKVGQGTALISGKGNYNGQQTIRFTIMPQTNKISRLTNKAGGKMLVKLSKSLKKTGAKGYEISYSLKKNFKGARKVKTTKTSYTLKNLKKGKTYYVRVRSFAQIGKKIKYGAYSKAVKRKVTK